MISYLSDLMLSMQVLESAVWIPVPELYLWGHMEDKTEGNATIQRREGSFSQKKTIFNLSVHLDLQKFTHKKSDAKKTSAWKNQQF